MATDGCKRCFACSVEDLVDEIGTHPSVKVLQEWELSSVERSGNAIEKIGVRPVGGGDETYFTSNSLVLATGFEPYDPSEKMFWGYGRFNGVITLAEMDALIRRDNLASFVADATEPVKVAFFQCVGSRDKSIGANYCSQYCCSGALRMALRLRHEHPEWEITIFYIDLQVAGKNAGELLAEASEKNVRLIQGVPGEILEGPDGMLEIVREQDGRNIREAYHRIVLSIGQRPSQLNRQTADVAGLSLDEFGFLASSALTDPCRTAAAGVYLAGTCSGPKNIEDTIDHAGQTAAAVIEDLRR
jgi:heterodisulfide reductase subunit A